MNPINIASPVSTMTVKQSGESASAKAEAPAAESSQAFSSLLKSLAGGAKQSDSSDQALPRQLLKKIEDMLAALQEQPVEELSEEQQKLMYELMQLVNLQPARKEGTILVDTTGKRKFTPVNPDAEKQVVPKEVQSKLIELVKKLSDILPATSAADTKKFDASTSLMGVDGETIALDAEKIEKIANKILEITGSLADSGKKVSVAAAQPDQTAKVGAVFPIESDKQLKVAGETKSVDVDEAQAAKAQASAAVVTAGRSDGGQQQETSQQDDNKQSLTQTAASADAAKPTAAPGQSSQPVQARPEPSQVPAPVVRMNNLSEELGEVFKNSMRMGTSGESTQIKVNISPDHLGHLDIRLTETNGKIAAQIFTSSMAAKDALDLQLNQLRSTLIQQGLTVEKIEVVQNNSQQSLGQQNAQSEQRFTQQQRQNNAARESNGYQQIEEKTAVQRSHLDSGMMKVDYTV
ncbi:flagellar hook-length control protein FliK [Planomicrobium sp. Y74]|uniref:flagellar hook-length control protein FliK n=1 Tax=Planomicrobium sp. Y74 TaxID=2478977 RepID=UPI0011C484F6|nr:flagellar hook-length control protein FliK [Planomicrobium sp. Y74]